MNISKYRGYLGMTQTEFSKILGISLQAYWRKENGRTEFNDKEKIIIRDLLLPHFTDITIDEIFFSEEVTKVAKD